MSEWCVQHHSAVRTLSDRICNKRFHSSPCTVRPDGRMPRIGAHDRVSARGDIEVHQEVDPHAANGDARWELCARGPRVLGQGDARDCRLATLSVSGLPVSSSLH